MTFQANVPGVQRRETPAHCEGGGKGGRRQGELLTLGYTEPNAMPRLDAFLAQPDTGLVDIRFSPRSRWYPEFNQAALLRRYGSLKYGHCRELGNVNYNKPGEPIELFTPEEGVRRVIRLLQSGCSVMLLCACKDYEHCHRKIAFDLIMAALASDETTESGTER